MEPRDRTPKWLRWTQHPSVLVLLGFGVLLGAQLSLALFLGRATNCHRGLGLLAHITDEGLVVCDQDECFESHTRLKSHQNPAAWISVRRVDQTSGLFFDTIRRHGTRIQVWKVPDQTIEGDLEAAAVEAALNSWYAPALAGCRPGEPVRVGVVWSGVLLNALCLSWVSAFVYGSLTRGRRAVRLERLKRGRCPVCRYRVDGLPTGVCPECGTAQRAETE